MIEQFCCAHCFEHPWLRELVRDQGAANGICAYCGAHGTRLVSLHQLAEPFQNLLHEYVGQEYRQEEISPGEDHWAARTLFDGVQEDWQVFSRSMQSESGRRLFADILSLISFEEGASLSPDTKVLKFSQFARLTSHRYWSRVMEGSLLTHYPSLEEITRDRMTYGTPEHILGETLNNFTARLSSGTTLYRARVGPQLPVLDAISPYSGAGISANPKHPAARANTDGQPVFYCSGRAKTAVAEVRPGTGQYVSVGEFTVLGERTVVDLCQDFDKPNPFTFKNLPFLLDSAMLLSEMACFISKPVQYGEDQSEYKSTQYFCNIVRSCGYDGLRYPSALDREDGYNIALFDPSSAVYQKSSLVVITRVCVEFRKADNLLM